jgi:hypothetical protein
VPCKVKKDAQHEIRNGNIATSFALAMDGCERVRKAIEPCLDGAECELLQVETPDERSRRHQRGGFWP